MIIDVKPDQSHIKMNITQCNIISMQKSFLGKPFFQLIKGLKIRGISFIIGFLISCKTAGICIDLLNVFTHFVNFILQSLRIQIRRMFLMIRFPIRNQIFGDFPRLILHHFSRFNIYNGRHGGSSHKIRISS